MDDTLVTALEHAIADLGTLVVQMDKFRASTTDEARGLRAACQAIGDRARRAHRHGTLDPALATELRADADAARAALTAWLATVRSSPTYRQAVAALAERDDATLRTSLVALFADVHVDEPPDVLVHPVPWQRRGRPRAAEDVARELVRWRDEGLPGDADPESAAMDPALPAVVLQPEPPPGAPLWLAIRGPARPAWVLVLEASGDLVVPGTRLHIPFAVALASPDDEEVDAWTLDPLAYRRSLEDALLAHAIPIDH